MIDDRTRRRCHSRSAINGKRQLADHAVQDTKALQGIVSSALSRR
jgi:hypothetical protein